MGVVTGLNVPSNSVISLYVLTCCISVGSSTKWWKWWLPGRLGEDGV